MIRVRNKSDAVDPGRATVPVHRPHPLGNPFFLKDGFREDVIARHRSWLREMYYDERELNIVRSIDEIVDMAMEGKDVDLVCYCRPEKCHAENILDLVMEIVERKRDAGPVMQL